MSDLRQLLDTARGDLPPAAFTVDDITRAGRRRIRRRRRLIGGLAAAGTAVVVAVAGLVPRTGPPAPVSAPAPLPAAPAGLTRTLTGYAVGDYRVGDPVQVTAGYEVAVVFRDHDQATPDDPAGISRPAGLVTVYRPGVFDPAPFRSGRAVTVAGRPGRERTFTDKLQLGDKSRTLTVNRTAVAWQYAADAWVVLRSNHDYAGGMSAAVVERLAARLTLGPPAPVTLPYRIGHRPAGYVLAAAGPGDITPYYSERISLAYLVKGDPGLHGLTAPADFSALGRDALAIEVLPDDPDDLIDATGRSAARPFRTCRQGVNGMFCDRPIGRSGYYAEVTDPSGTLSAAELRAVADGLTFADPAKPATWYPAGR